MSEIVPEGWFKASLEEICKVKTGNNKLTKKVYTERGYPAFSGSGQDGFCDFYENEGEALVVASVGARCGRSFKAIGRWTAIANTTIIFPNSKMVLNDYLFECVGDENSWNKSGGAQPFVSVSEIQSKTVLLPPLPEQKKIASILTSVDEVIETTQKQIDKLQDLKKATMNELLTKGIGHTEFKDSELGRIPEDWDVGDISEIAGILSGYAFSSSDFVDSGVLCIRMGNLYGNTFDKLRSPVFLPEEFITQHPKFVINSGDLLLSMTGTAGKRDYGFLVEVPNGFEQGLLNQRVSKIVPNNPTAKSFICELMRSEFYLEELFSFGSGTKQANLSASQIMGIVVPIPPLDEQVRIGELISSIGKSIHRNETKLSQTQSLKKSLMQDLLTGKVRVQVN